MSFLFIKSDFSGSEYEEWLATQPQESTEESTANSEVVTELVPIPLADTEPQVTSVPSLPQPFIGDTTESAV